MNTSTRCGLVIAGLVVVGCGGLDETKGGEAVSDRGATLVFADSFADGGLLRVVEDSQKNLGIAVQAPVGSVAEALLRKSISAATLEDVYLALHVEASDVPPHVREWSRSIEAQKLEQAQPSAELEGEPGAELLPPAAISAETVDKSESDFMTNYCRTFSSGNTTKYVPIECNWYPNTWLRTTPWILSSDGSYIDRAYGWNATQWRSWMAALGSGNNWEPWVSPFSVMWVQWGGVYSGAQVRLSIENGHGDAAGEMGLTVHDARPIVR